MLEHQKTDAIRATEKRTREAVDGYMDAWQRNDREALLALYAEDAVWIDPVGTPPMVGRPAIGAFWDKSHAGGNTLTPEVQRIIVCGNEAILLFRMRVRGAKGGGMDLEVCDHFIVGEDGKIQQAKAFWDTACIQAPSDD